MLNVEGCFAGMMDLKGAHEWVVTTKLGSSDVRPGTTPTVTRNCRMYAGEMAMSGFVLGAAFYGVFTVNRWTFSIFLFLQVRASGSGVASSGWLSDQSERLSTDARLLSTIECSPHLALSSAVKLDFFRLR